MRFPSSWFSVVCQRLDVPPPGVLMFVLTSAVGSSLPGGFQIGYVLAVLAAGVLAAALTVIPHLSEPAAPRQPRSPVWLASLRTALGVGLAGVAAVALRMDRPYWAMIAAIAVLAQGTYASIANRRALLRAIGCVAGCALAAPVLWLHPTGYAAALVLGVLMFMIELVAPRNHALGMVYIVPLSTLLATAARPNPILPTLGTLLANTALGCIAGIVAGQFVSRAWIHNQRFRVIVDTLHAAEAALDDKRHVPKLRQMRAKAQLMAQHSVGERANVAETAKAWNEIAEHTDRVAEQVLIRPDEHNEIKSEIQRLRDRAEDHWRRNGTHPDPE
ncbi:FUSC family protein [Kibdelosporangium philippinense]|uniref:FUSC family protein n=1 Tax=Kibdelosporangium philippinense TaxID=211113 RepID=A0ABS8Z0Z7_9PSEU|nr:FUSC family protein [Kibdelosporangium philippinense]MCE7001425.1 FUSC family protein [Kibdelosporangium philippinense]